MGYYQNTKKENVKLPSKIITYEKYIPMKREWDAYYEKSQKTHARERFHQQMIAFKLNDMKFVQGCAKQAKLDMQNANYELVKPVCDDPDMEIKAGRLGVKEWLLGYYLKEGSNNYDYNTSIRSAIDTIMNVGPMTPDFWERES